MSAWERHTQAKCPDTCFYCKRDGVRRPLTPEVPDDSPQRISNKILLMGLATMALMMTEPPRRKK